MTEQNETGGTSPDGRRRPLPDWLIPSTVLTVLAGGATFGLMRLTWPRYAGTPLQRHVLQMSDALLALVVALAVLALSVAVQRARDSRVQDPVSVKHRLRLFLGLWVVFAIPLLLWWGGEWPGHFYGDVRSSMRVSAVNALDPWLSSFYGLWFHALRRGAGGIPAISLVNVLVFSALLADFFSLLFHLGLSRRVGGLFIALVVTSVPLGLLLICLSHDVLNGVLRLGVALVLLRIGTRRVLTGQRGTTPMTLPALGVLMTGALLLRGDSLALLPYIPAVLLLTRQARPAAALVLVLCTFGTVQVFRRAIEPRLVHPDPEFRNRYGVSLILNPMGFMLQNYYYTPTPDEDRAAIDAIVNFECLAGQYVLDGSDCFWTALRFPLTDEKLKAVQRIFVRSVRDNPGLFLANRVATFLGTLGLDPRVLWPFLYWRDDAPPHKLYPERDIALMQSQGLDPARAPQALARVTRWLRTASYPKEGGRFLYFPWNGVPALLLTVWLLTRWRTLPVSAAVAAVVAGPTAAVFLAEPAGHITYVSDLWMFGYLAIPLAWFEHTVLRPRRQAAGNAGTSVRSA